MYCTLVSWCFLDSHGRWCSLRCLLQSANVRHCLMEAGLLLSSISIHLLTQLPFYGFVQSQSYSHLSSPQYTRPHLQIEKFLPRPDSITLSIWHEQWSCCVHESAGIVLHGETDRYSSCYRVCAIKLDTVPIPFTRPSIRCSRLFEPCQLRSRVTQPVGQIMMWQGTCMPSWHQCLQHQQRYPSEYFILICTKFQQTSQFFCFILYSYK